jgi:sortase A
VLGTGWATARGVAWVSERRSLRAFEEARSVASAVVAAPGAASPAPFIDQRLWDPGRIRAYARALTRPAPPPMAVLRIPRLRLEVPVLEGTDEWTLDRGVGHIPGTARPEQDGNVGIAGHRDGFFRVLKDVAVGEVMELALVHDVRRYRVDRLAIVDPHDVAVLAPAEEARLTLVTCYPFYFVGSAPQRYIVRARLETSRQLTEALARPVR